MKDAAAIRMLQAIARALTPLKEEMVFLGGATVALYLQDSKVRDSPTNHPCKVCSL